jgi:hypothetical protein
VTAAGACDQFGQFGYEKSFALCSQPQCRRDPISRGLIHPACPPDQPCIFKDGHIGMDAAIVPAKRPRQG